MRRKIPEYEVGERVGKDGNLVVLQRLPDGRGGKDKMYLVKCETCAKDQELFGKAEYAVSKDYLLKGKLPCGCSKAGTWTREQVEVMVRRKCRESNYTFLGIDKWEGILSKIKLLCKEHNHTWNTTDAKHFIKTGGGCKVCMAQQSTERQRYPDHVMVESFMRTGRFAEGTVFTRRSSSRWTYTCPKCSTDEFVRASLCSGEFESVTCRLQAGSYACRCSTRFLWTEEQQEYRIKKILSSDARYTFVGWYDEYRDVYSRAILNCTQHGEWDVSVTSLTKHGAHCACCAENGYKVDKEGSLYVLQCEGRHGFVGYGISNIPDRRLAEHARNLRRAGYTVGATQIFSMSGLHAWKIEQLLKKTFPCNPQDISGFRTEATCYENYQAVCDFVDKWLFENS